MAPSDSRPWRLLLSRLRRSDPARIRGDELLVAHDSNVADRLLREGLIAYGPREDYVPPDCEHGCLPDLDFATRAPERLVGVACPNEEPCWRGRSWVRACEVISFRCGSASLFAALRQRNGLAPLHLPAPGGFTPVGLLRRRGREVPVVWSRPRPDFAHAVLGLKRQLATQGLIVLVPRPTSVTLAPLEHVAIIALPDGDDGDLELTRGLDVIDPHYRDKAAQRSEPEAEIDWITLHFATTPERHVLIVNGHDFVGFRKGDALFARLLYLAAERRFGARGGWKKKATLVADFAPQPPEESLKRADRALEALRAELIGDDVPGLTSDDQDAILKTDRGTGLVRCAVVPENISFDDSLAELTWKVHTTTTSRAGTTKLSKRQADGVDDAQMLLTQARRLGVPGLVEEVTPPPIRKRPASRSAR